MQVMTRVHDDKYEAFGGNFAAFDPVTNLRVGAQVLKECISRAGSLPSWMSRRRPSTGKMCAFHRAGSSRYRRTAAYADQM